MPSTAVDDLAQVALMTSKQLPVDHSDAGINHIAFDRLSPHNKRNLITTVTRMVGCQACGPVYDDAVKHYGVHCACDVLPYYFTAAYGLSASDLTKTTNQIVPQPRTPVAHRPKARVSAENVVDLNLIYDHDIDDPKLSSKHKSRNEDVVEVPDDDGADETPRKRIRTNPSSCNSIWKNSPHYTTSGVQFETDDSSPYSGEEATKAAGKGPRRHASG